MKLSFEEVEHIAALARLSLTDSEMRQYSEQLSNILDYAARLDELETEQIPPTASVLQTPLRLREDIAHPGLTPSEVLRNAAETKDGQFKVPPVLGS